MEYVTGDLATGEGIDAAVTGVETVVHCAGSAKGDDVKARHLVRAASGRASSISCTSPWSAPTASR
ncbi:hypothetical protein ACFQ1L_13255 [Phytohabitans flavus]|uniref:hypothetical protein n=1 Tax=Phytohabitans flavus TaxID=1076124 RepID=UPI00362DEA18